MFSNSALIKTSESHINQRREPLTTPWTIHKFNCHDLIPPRRETLWLLKWGVVRSLTWDEDGSIITLGYWGAKDVISSSFLAKEPQQFKCLTSVEAWSIPHEHWYHYSDAICHHLQRSQELLAIVRIGKIHQRLWQFLLWLSHKFGHQVEQGKLIQLRLTHQDIAETVGISRVSVTRLLGQLEQEQKIYRAKRHLIICSPT